jgi:hypothetical protein
LDRLSNGHLMMGGVIPRGGDGGLEFGPLRLALLAGAGDNS